MRINIIAVVLLWASISINAAGKSFPSSINLIYCNKIANTGMSFNSFEQGISGYNKICDSLHICYRYLFIADFNLPSTHKRLYVLDMIDTSVVHTEYVSHGRNSGELYAQYFSNTVSSYQSSLGFYLISETYDGKHGLSIRLDGLDMGFNDKARERAIVIHAADYAHPTYITANGRMGRSHGCPALSQQGLEIVAALIKQKSILFIYYPQKEYLSQSIWLNQNNSGEK